MNFPVLAFLVIVLVLAFLVLTGCTLTVSPDGSRTYAPDPDTLRVILEK